MKKMLLILLVMVGLVAAALWLRRPEPVKAATHPVLPDRKAFDTWQDGVRLDTRTDYQAGKESKREPRRN